MRRGWAGRSTSVPPSWTTPAAPRRRWSGAETDWWCGAASTSPRSRTCAQSSYLTSISQPGSAAQPRLSNYQSIWLICVNSYPQSIGAARHAADSLPLPVRVPGLPGGPGGGRPHRPARPGRLSVAAARPGRRGAGRGAGRGPAPPAGIVMLDHQTRTSMK